MKAIFNIFNKIFLLKSIESNIELEKYFQSKKITINFINEHHIDEEFVVIYLKDGDNIVKDVINT